MSTAIKTEEVGTWWPGTNLDGKTLDEAQEIIEKLKEASPHHTNHRFVDDTAWDSPTSFKIIADRPETPE